MFRENLDQEKNKKKKRSDAALTMYGSDQGHGLGMSENNNNIDEHAYMH